MTQERERPSPAPAPPHAQLPRRRLLCGQRTLEQLRVGALRRIVAPRRDGPLEKVRAVLHHAERLELGVYFSKVLLVVFQYLLLEHSSRCWEHLYVSPAPLLLRNPCLMELHALRAQLENLVGFSLVTLDRGDLGDEAAAAPCG